MDKLRWCSHLISKFVMHLYGYIFAKKGNKKYIYLLGLFSFYQAVEQIQNIANMANIKLRVRLCHANPDRIGSFWKYLKEIFIRPIVAYSHDKIKFIFGKPMQTGIAFIYISVSDFNYFVSLHYLNVDVCGKIN